MIKQIEAALYRGGNESDARLHLAVGVWEKDQELPVHGCAGDHAQMVLRVFYEAIILDEQAPPIRDAIMRLAEAVTVLQLARALPEQSRARLCQRCAGRLIDTVP